MPATAAAIYFCAAMESNTVREYYDIFPAFPDGELSATREPKGWIEWQSGFCRL